VSNLSEWILCTNRTQSWLNMQVIMVAIPCVSQRKKRQNLFVASNFNGQILSYHQTNTICSLSRRATKYPKVRTSMARILKWTKLNFAKATCRFKTSLYEEFLLVTLILIFNNRLEIGIYKLLVFRTVTWVGSKFNTQATSKLLSRSNNSNFSTFQTFSQYSQIVFL